MVSEYELSTKVFDVEGSNKAFSPLSYYCVMVLLMQGATGETRKELQEALQLTDNSFKEYGDLVKELNKSMVAVQCILAKDIQPRKDFKHDVENAYGALKLTSSEDETNKYVAEKTNNTIKNLINGNVEGMALVNAIYFKKDWKHQFNSDLTREQQFYVDNNTVRLTPFMNQSKLVVPYTHSEGYEALELPYTDENYSMVFIKCGEKLPNKTTVQTLLFSLQNKEVDVSIPKFTLEGGVKLNKLTQNIGINRIFNLGKNFPNMTDENLFVDKIYQKTFMKVDESGTEASAATAVFTLGVSDTNPNKITFVLDEPFLAILRYKNTTVFYSYVVDPTQTQSMESENIFQQTQTKSMQIDSIPEQKRFPWIRTIIIVIVLIALVVLGLYLYKRG